MTQERFADRREAGRALAECLSQYAWNDDVVVLGLPRGGVPVAYEVATALRAPLDVLVVRKLGVPGHDELAFGAIASGGVQVRNDDVIDQAGLDAGLIAQVAAEQRLELERRERLYRGSRAPLEVRGRSVLVVDDGLATGATMKAAVLAVRELGASLVGAAVPTAARQTCEQIARVADAVECVYTPDPFVAVGLWYVDFAPTTDAEVRALLGQR